MIDVSTQELDFIIKTLKKYFPEAKFWVFGSRINGKTKPYSDLDVAIVSDNKLELDAFNQLTLSFEESELPFRIDLVDYSKTSDSFKKIILQNYEVLY